MTNPVKLLCLEDVPEDAELALRTIQDAGMTVELTRVETESDFRRALADLRPDVVLCDYAVPGWDGMSALETMSEMAPDTPVIMFTGTLSDEKAVACLRAGAMDYVLKGRPMRLSAAVASALSVRREAREKSAAEAALRESERRFRTVVDSAADAIITMDEAGIIEQWNAAAEEIFGHSAAEMVGESVQRVLPEKFRTIRRQLLREGRESGLPFRRIVMLNARRRDGTEFPVELSLSSMTLEGHSSFTAVVRDRTDAFEARQAIERLSQQHELLLNSAGEGILGVEDDARISFANPAALSLLGHRAADMVGEHLSSVLHCCDPEEPCPLVSSVATGSAFRGDLEFRRSDGRALPVAVSLTPVKEGDGISGGVLIFEDITLRKSQESALQASEATYRSLVDNAPYGIYRSTMDGRFLSVNPALVSMLGYEREELLALDLNDALYRRAGDRTRYMEQVRDSGPRFVLETTWVRKDGGSLSARLTGRVVHDPEGQSDFYEVFVEDLTERRILEGQLRQAQKMETVGQLTGGIAHDFNNVLAVVLLNTELAMAALERGQPVELEDLQTIQMAAQRASGITRKLLGFSRRSDLQLEATQLDQVVTSLEGMLRTALPETIDLRIDATDAAAPALLDSGSIEQIILNLVTNSRDALPDGGQVAVTVREQVLDGEECRLRPGLKPGKHICLSVADTGTGMDEETLRRVFDPFFTTKPSGAGTGLGMAMVYGLTKQQQGFVQVDSEVGAGTTTTLYFPVCCVGSPSPGPEKAAPATAHQAGTLLLVEDEDNLRGVATRALEASGFRVLAAASGDEALDLYAGHAGSIDVVLSDLVLPGMTGLELREALHSRYGHVPFVLTSGYSGQPPVKGGISPDIPFVRKPWTLSDLLAVVRNAMAAPPPPRAGGERGSTHLMTLLTPSSTGD